MKIKTLSSFLFTSRSVILNSSRSLRYLRKEYLGEYLPKVDEKHLDEHRSNKFTKYSKIDPKQDFELGNESASSKMNVLYPEMYNYLPVPGVRDQLRERLERREMMKRRQHIHIPEFYVGSIMAATISDKYSQSKLNRFVGICIFRNNFGLLSTFRLRNVLDNIGIEMEFEMYNPTLVKVEVLKLEKRLDENLFYLRDAPYHYSKIPFDMVPVPHDPASPVPVNDTKVVLNPRPWICLWTHHNYRGIDDSCFDMVDLKRMTNAETQRTSFNRYDLMMMYRDRGPAADKHETMRHVEIMHHDLIKYQESRHRDEIAKTKIERRK